MSFFMLALLPLLPQLVGEGVISTSADEAGFTATADENEAWFVVHTPATVGRTQEIICHVRKVAGAWGEPEVASFSGKFRDHAPALAPDGQTLYFISNRDADGLKPKGDFDIWKVEREGDGWSAPVRLPAPVNSEGQEVGVSVAADGTLYFASTRPGGRGELDLYRAKRSDDGWAEPENLGDGVNTIGSEAHPAISPDGKTLVFTAYGRDDEMVGVHAEYRKGDLYVSHLQADGKFGPARNAGKPVNSGAGESNPMFSPNGKTLYFASERGFATERLKKRLDVKELTRRLNQTLNGMGNIYRVDASVLR